jgi:hypothetical protein
MKVAFQVIRRNGESDALQGPRCIVCPVLRHKNIDVPDNTQALRRSWRTRAPAARYLACRN